MSNVIKIITKDEDEVIDELKKLVESCATESISEKGEFLVGVSGKLLYFYTWFFLLWVALKR